MKAVHLIGRILFGGFFLYNGVNHLMRRREIGQYAGSKGIPMPETSVELSGILLLIGGTSVILGLKPQLGAAALVAFLAGVSPTMHDFWSAEDPQQKQNQMIHFMKNLALLGAALALMGSKEPWPVSIPLGQKKPSPLESVWRALAA